LGAYPTQSKTVLVDLGDLGLRGWQSLGGFLTVRVIHVDDFYQVLLITLTHGRLRELFLLPCKLLLLLHRYASPSTITSVSPQGPELRHVVALLFCYRWFQCT
jgi:hypothetical protein